MKTDKLFSRYSVFAFSVILLLLSCKNDFEINAEYEDITVVYGIIDPGVQKQFIRINRTFLTEGNVLDAATVMDSSNYPYKLNVQILEYNEYDQLITQYFLDTVHLPKTDGVFNTGYQPYYFFESPSYVYITQYNDYTKDTVYFNPKHKFILKIENPITDKITESETGLIYDMQITRPLTYNRFISFISQNHTNVEMKSVKNAKLYEAKFIFFYREEHIDTPGVLNEKQLTWKLGSVRAERISGGEDLSIGYIPYTFFNILKAKISENPHIKRYHGTFMNANRVDIQLVITAGGLELVTYIDSNMPSSSVVQDRPVYTNVSNGIGIFSSKRTTRINYQLNVYTVDSLRHGSTAYLNFQ